MLDDVLRDSGMSDKLQIRLEVSSWTTIMAYAADGLGVGLVSELLFPVVEHGHPLSGSRRDPAIPCQSHLPP